MVEEQRGGEKARLNEPFPVEYGEGGSFPQTAGESAPRIPVPDRTGSLTQALVSDPSDGKLKEGIRLFRMKRWDKALQELSRYQGKTLDDKEQLELAYYLGLCYAKLERYSEALPCLEQVTAGHNVLRVYQCRMTLAYIYLITEQPKMAETELKRLQRTGFESAQLYNSLAFAAYTQKRYKDAVELYEKALEVDENNTTAMNSLGYILADTGMDVLRGLRFCRRAVERKPRIPAYLDSLGWACYKGGELPEARTWLRRALDMAPAEPGIKEHYRIATGEVL